MFSAVRWDDFISSFFFRFVRKLKGGLPKGFLEKIYNSKDSAPIIIRTMSTNLK